MYYHYRNFNYGPRPVYYADKVIRDFYDWLINNQKLNPKEGHQYIRAIKGLEKFTYSQGFFSKKLFSENQNEIFTTVEELLVNSVFQQKYLPKYRSYPVNPASAISKLVEYADEALTPQNNNEPNPAVAPDPTSSLAHHPVEIKDVLIRDYSFRCSNHHKTEYVGEVPVLTKDGTIKMYLARIWYCKDCNYYFILNPTFLNLKKKGIILCRVMDYSTYTSIYTSIQHTQPWYTSPFFKLSPISPLRLCGYCVNQKEGLTDIQRHTILEIIVDNDILPRDRVMSYLVFFQEKIHAGDIAKEKWKADYDYIEQYKLNSAKHVFVEGFIRS